MPIAARGRKDPALAAALRGEAPPPLAVDYFVARRPLKVGDEVRQPGDPIPEAASWPRLDSWLNTGMIVARPKSAESILAEQARTGAQHEAEMAEEPEPEVAPPPPAKKAVAKKAAPRPRSSSPGRAQRVRPKRPDAPEGTDAPVLRPPRRDG